MGGDDGFIIETMSILDEVFLSACLLVVIFFFFALLCMRHTIAECAIQSTNAFAFEENSAILRPIKCRLSVD